MLKGLQRGSTCCELPANQQRSTLVAAGILKKAKPGKPVIMKKRTILVNQGGTAGLTRPFRGEFLIF